MFLVELGYGCNNACVFCAQGQLRARQRAVPAADVAALVDSAPAEVALAFVGGEPTLVPELAELVGRARRRGIEHVVVQTNGRRLASAGYAEQLAEAGVTGFEVSLHGPNEAVHDYHTAVPGSFRQTVAGLYRVRGTRVPFVITTVVTRSNFRHLSEIVRVVHTLGARAIRFAAVEPYGSARAAAARIVPAPALVQPRLERALRNARELGLDYVAGELRSAPESTEWFAGIGPVELENSSEVRATERTGLERHLPVVPSRSGSAHEPHPLGAVG
jgi:MoaA/NifB/PqqE/SkfB family radical SAM enzyme